MLAVLPLLLFISVFVWGRFRSPNEGWRAIWFKTAITLGVFVASSSNLLSLTQQLNTSNLTGACIVVLLGIWWLLWRDERRIGSLATWHQWWLGRWRRLQPAHWPSKAVYYWLFLISILAVTLTIALVAAPNNYDSMTYHLS